MNFSVHSFSTLVLVAVRAGCTARTVGRLRRIACYMMDNYHDMPRANRGHVYAHALRILAASLAGRVSGIVRAGGSPSAGLRGAAAIYRQRANHFSVFLEV